MSNLEEYFTRDNSKTEFSESLSSDIESDELIDERRTNRKRLRKLSTSSKEKNSEGGENIETSRQDGTLFWSKRNLTPVVHIFDDQNSGVKENLNPESTTLDAFQMMFPEELVCEITEQIKI